MSDSLAQRLILAQFPQLAPATATLLGEGWDNAAFLVNGAYVFRFPRREIAAQLIAHECGVLPLAAPQLPLAVPVPALRGQPSPQYPWRFAGYPQLPGVPLSEKRPSDEEYRRLAAPLGEFLRALHALDCAPLREAGLPSDTLGRLDRARMLPKMRARLETLQSAGFLDETRRMLALVERVAPGQGGMSRALVHGDLYARHILVDERFVPIAIIDWGDVHFGDPAVDLSIAFSILAPPMRERFFEAYGGVDEATIEAARFRAGYHATMVAHYGYRIGDGDLLYIGLRGMRFAAA